MKIRRHITIRTVPLLIVMLLSLLLIPAGEANAANAIVLSAECEKSVVGQGDLVRIDITADHFPDIISLGPIVVRFDSDKAQFYKLVESEALTSSMYYSFTQTSDTVTTTAVDKMASFGDEAGDDNEINPYSSENKTILYSLYFRILSSAAGTADFLIESADGFLNVKQKEVKNSIQSGVTLIVNQSVSQDATLTFLDLGPVALTPDFDPHITEYDAVVERSVSAIDVKTTATNNFSAVTVKGNRALAVGDNKIEIDVTAQNGQTHMTYVINVFVKESYVPENAVLVDGEGTLYNFVDLPQEYDLPEGFTQSTKNLNGYLVPAFSKDGILSVIVYLYDGVNQPGFYFYNVNTKRVTPYVSGGTVVSTGQVYTNMSGNDSIPVPDGFKSFVLEAEDQTVKGYKNSAGDFICFLVDEQGNGDFYQYDQENDTFYKYVKPDNSRELMYRFLFTISFIAAVTEAVIIIIIVTLVRKLIADKSTPRPKRV
ncbi:MAG: cadherin-like beta sandwich domain-containing protein [Clostridiales bacterium]|nr:cadherin-like beta sandwich domain-containing protein [Clostridiales bacterium]MBO4580417.1 cadherin-like beta sandwich domain-containing protein [Clostridiales bacterium]